MLPELKLDAELDLKPEYCHYRDDGCELGESCLNCRLPICVYDEPRGRRRWLRQQRDKEIVRLYTKGKSVSRLALQFNISRRTIQRTPKTAGRKTAVLFFDEHNPKEAVVIAVYG